MTFITRPHFADRQIRQLSGDSITLSGLTNFFGILQSKGVEIDGSTIGATPGYILKWNGTKIKLEADTTGRGNAIIENLTGSTSGFTIGHVIGYDTGTTSYIGVTALRSGSTALEVIGIVSKIYDATSFEITYQGIITGITQTLVPGSTYFLTTNPLSAGTLTLTETTTIGQISKPLLVALSASSGLFVNWRGNIIVSGSSGGGGGSSAYPAIGQPTDGDYSDGLLPLTSGDTIADTVDAFNELFALFAPSPSPALSNISKTGTGTFSTAKLSFGVSNNDAGYTVVTTAAGNVAVDINGTYTLAGTRLGVTNGTNITGILNDSVPVGPSYPADSFGDGEKGKLELYFNGALIDTLILSGGTGATASTRMSVSAALPVLTVSSSPFPFFRYRTGIYTLPNSIFVNGFNYLRIFHVKPSGTAQTNFLEFTYDPDANAIAFVASPAIISPVLSGMTGSKYISGVQYHTGGNVRYSAQTSNVYRNVYSASLSAFAYPSRVNIADATTIHKFGAGITSETNAVKNLPALNPGAINPAQTTLRLVSTHAINASRVLGNVGTFGRVETNFTVTHPLKATLLGGTASSSGFLVDNVTQVPNDNTENFDGELGRMQNRSYLADTYAVADAATFLWVSTESLIGANPTHNNGLLIFNGELLYPSAAYLTSQYGITSGNFAAVTNGYGGNPNYSLAVGIRDHTRRYKMTNSLLPTQATMTLDILHTGTNSDFLTNGGTGGVASGNNIKVECVIKRTTNVTHGVFNPFASTGNPEGIANTAITSIPGGTRVSCTLSTVPRIGLGDLVFVNIKASAAWTNRIQNVQVVNII